VNDKQLFTNAAQVLQDKLDLLDTMNLTEVGVDQRTPLESVCVSPLPSSHGAT
jgi:hypothetical protein